MANSKGINLLNIHFYTVRMLFTFDDINNMEAAVLCKNRDNLWITLFLQEQYLNFPFVFICASSSNGMKLDTTPQIFQIHTVQSFSQHKTNARKSLYECKNSYLSCGLQLE